MKDNKTIHYSIQIIHTHIYYIYIILLLVYKLFEGLTMFDAIMNKPNTTICSG